MTTKLLKLQYFRYQKIKKKIMSLHLAKQWNLPQPLNTVDLNKNTLFGSLSVTSLPFRKLSHTNQPTDRPTDRPGHP